MVDELNNRLPIAEVVWEDAWIEADDVSTKEAIQFVPVLRSTVGYVISKDNDDCLVLATDLYQEDQTIINTPMVIPWGAIIDWWEYDVH